MNDCKQNTRAFPGLPVLPAFSVRLCTYCGIIMAQHGSSRLEAVGSLPESVRRSVG